ncbi:ABC transporter ATP-binding protein [Aeromicrobium alkaliterrae]|uniref:ABC transporter ATP-binding protein n=1 Tax=Aeromicrobium alkaliterrae TaxID=302168 RepID=A0ABP4VI56_9ACTN
MYSITGLTKTYATKERGTISALAGVDLEIADGELVSIQGPTGGGKSTLLQMLGALDRPTDGSIKAFDHDLAALSDAELTTIRAQSIGFVFQHYNLIPTLTAAENVEAAILPVNSGGKVTAQARAERAREVLAQVGLADRATHRPAELSGGQQQRVAIARALVKRPEVLLADEPTGNLDEAMRDEIWDVIETLHAERGLTVVLVTHDTAIARRTPRRLRIANGRLTELD